MQVKRKNAKSVVLYLKLKSYVVLQNTYKETGFTKVGNTAIYHLKDF